MMMMLRRPSALRGLVCIIRPRVRVLHIRTADAYSRSSTTVGRARFRGAGGLHICWVGGWLVASSSLVASRIVALCEEEDDAAVAADDDDDDDPYANLPEEDEETSCTLCKTFRQGPCGPPWRKLERCFKDNADNGDQGGGANRCTRYFTAHHECVSNFTNLYHLISLDQKQELIANTEKAVNDNERVCWPKAVADDFFDWSQWRSYCQDVGMTSSSYLLHTKVPPRLPAPPAAAAVPSNEVVDDATSPPQLLPPLWKRGPENTEPLLIATEVKVPTTEQNGMLLKFAYVVDQDGFALGVTFHDYHRKQSEQQERAAAAAAAEKKANNVTENTEETDAAADVGHVARTEADDDPPFTLRTDVTLEFYILPGDTRTVQLCALYTEDPSQVDESKKIMDAFLYKTIEYQLADQC